MPHEELQRPVAFAPDVVHQTEAVDGGAKDGDQVVVVGFDVAMLGHPIMAGGEGMHEPGVEPRVAKGPPHNLMVGACHFDADNHVSEAAGGNGFVQRKNGHVKFVAAMLDDGGRNQHPAIEVAQHPLGPILGTVDADDAKPLGSGLLDTGLNYARGLPQHGLHEGLRASLCTLFTGLDFCNHDNCLSVRKRFKNISHISQLKRFF